MNKSVHDTLYNKRRCEERAMGSRAKAGTKCQHKERNGSESLGGAW
jgi:hypothetical protein